MQMATSLPIVNNSRRTKALPINLAEPRADVPSYRPCNEANLFEQRQVRPAVDEREREKDDASELENIVEIDCVRKFFEQ